MKAVVTWHGLYDILLQIKDNIDLTVCLFSFPSSVNVLLGADKESRISRTITPYINCLLPLCSGALLLSVTLSYQDFNSNYMLLEKDLLRIGTRHWSLMHI